MKAFSICTTLILQVTLIFAQAPQRFSFQGVARKPDGKVVVNAMIGVRLTIHAETTGGTVVYQETHTAQTNTFGIFNVQIGGGNVVSGQLATISWKTFPYFLQLEMDPSGGSTYTDLGTTQMLSVPYAMQAAEAAKWNDGYPVIQKFEFGPDVDLNDPDVANDPDIHKYSLPAIGDGMRLIWYPSKGAFRAGEALNGKWEDSEIGDKSVAFGGNNIAKGDFSLAMGIETSATGTASAAIGQGAVASNNASAAIGLNVSASGYAGTAIGEGVFSHFRGEFAAGMFNATTDVSGDSYNIKPNDILFQIGNGTSINDRKSALTLLRSGNFGISNNVVAPEYLLDVGGRIRIRHNGATSGIQFNNSQNVVDGFVGMKTDAQIGFFLNGAWRFWIDNAGNGTLGGTLTQSSDRRLKRNFAPLSASLSKLTALQGYHYYWKGNGDPSLQTGLIAQEVEALFPELVKTDDNGFKSLNYTGLIPHLIESVKQLAKQNARLEAENASFKADSKAVQDQLTKLALRLDQLSGTTSNTIAK